jgi:Beta-eliminating lyase
MCDIDRRDFIRMGSVGAAGLGLTGAAVSSAAGVLEANRPVFFQGDGLNLGPREYADVLAGITADGDLEEDYYSNGGVVEDLEKRMAGILGKERAVFLPTGTLANHLAIRLLCEANGGRRVVTQAESHVSNDVGDDCETLAGLRVLGLAQGEVGFTLEEVQAEHARARASRVKVGIGTISIESPVRRKLDGLFHTRRMYGGSLIRGWVYAAVAQHFLDGFEDRLQRGIAVSEDLFSRIEKHPAFTLRRTPGGSNVFVLDVRGTDPKVFQERVAAAGISMREPRDDGSIVVQVNETWASVAGEELGRRMDAALD